MKKYTLEWSLSRRSMALSRFTKPKPFPGKYPTRIAWQGLLIDGTKVSYIGKPTRQALRKYQFWLRSYMFRTIWIIEFDLTGVVARDKSISPATRTCDTVALRKAYHPLPEGTKFFRDAGEWRLVLQGEKKQIVFWPDNVPFNPRICADYALGYIMPTAGHLTPAVPPVPEPTPETVPTFMNFANPTTVQWQQQYQQLTQELREYTPPTRNNNGQ